MTAERHFRPPLRRVWRAAGVSRLVGRRAFLGRREGCTRLADRNAEHRWDWDVTGGLTSPARLVEVAIILLIGLSRAGVAQDATLPETTPNGYVSLINAAGDACQREEYIEARRLLEACASESGKEDRRGFEWHLLSRIVDETPRPWRRSQGAVHRARFSPDGTLLATAGDDGVRVWSWPEAELVKHLTAHKGRVDGIAFSPDGGLLATGGVDRTVRTWEIAGWQEYSRYQCPSGDTADLCFLNEGQLLAVAERHLTHVPPNEPSFSQVIRYHTVPDLADKARFIGPGGGELQAIALSPDGKCLASAGKDWDAAFLWPLPHV